MTKRHMEKQIRRLKKVDSSTGLSDNNRDLRLDLYFQNFSGQHLHPALESMLSQTLNDVKVLSGPPPAPVAPPPPPQGKQPDIRNFLFLVL